MSSCMGDTGTWSVVSGSVYGPVSGSVSSVVMGSTQSAAAIRDVTGTGAGSGGILGLVIDMG